MNKPTPKKPKLMVRLRQALRVRHYSYATEKTYVHWVLDYIRFHKITHPKEMAEPEVSAYLTHLASKRNVAASTQKQALCAIVFLYKHVLEQPLVKKGPLGVASPLDAMPRPAAPAAQTAPDTPKEQAAEPLRYPTWLHVAKKAAVFLAAVFLPWRTRM